MFDCGSYLPGHCACWWSCIASTLLQCSSTVTHGQHSIVTIAEHQAQQLQQTAHNFLMGKAQ
jgi:hypothetical protein